jgi:hypothetical protein
VSGGDEFVPQSALIGYGTIATLGTANLTSTGLVSFTGSLSMQPAQAGLVDYDYLNLTVRCNLVLTAGSSDFELAFVYAGTGDRTGPSIIPISLTGFSGGPGTLSLRCQVASANNGGHFILIGGRFAWLTGS